MSNAIGGPVATTRPETARASLSQAEFYSVCKRLEADALIPKGELSTDQILERHKFAVPGRVLSRVNVLKALKTTGLSQHVRRPRVFGNSGGPMKIAFMRLDRIEQVLKAVCRRAGIDCSLLDEKIILPSAEDANGQA